MDKVAKLRKAAELINEANCLQQEALDAGQKCRDLHNDMENIIQDLDDLADKMAKQSEAKYTVDQIANAAEKACFYVTPEGLWLRVQYCDMDEGYLQGLDEDSGEEYRIEFDDLVSEDVHFEQLTKMQL